MPPSRRQQPKSTAGQTLIKKFPDSLFAEGNFFIGLLFDYLTASFKTFPALNFGFIEAAI